MGHFLDAHRQRYIESGDFETFWLDFETALKDDALTARDPRTRLRSISPLFRVDGDRVVVESFPSEPAPTTEELLAAFEPPKAVVVARSNPYRGNSRPHDYLEKPSAFPRYLNVFVAVVSILMGIIGALGFILSHLTR